MDNILIASDPFDFYNADKDSLVLEFSNNLKNSKANRDAVNPPTEHEFSSQMSAFKQKLDDNANKSKSRTRIAEIGDSLKGSRKEVYDQLLEIGDDQTREYLIKLAKRESNFDPKIVNRYGYSGLFQFGEDALTTLKQSKKIKNMTLNEFRNSSVHVQAHAAAELANFNWNLLKNHASDKIGSNINGIKVTKNGILAASHLVGAGRVRTWLNTNGKSSAKDANGTTIESYMKMFS